MLNSVVTGNNNSVYLWKFLNLESQDIRDLALQIQEFLQLTEIWLQILEFL